MKNYNFLTLKGLLIILYSALLSPAEAASAMSWNYLYKISKGPSLGYIMGGAHVGPVGATVSNCVLDYFDKSKLFIIEANPFDSFSQASDGFIPKSLDIIEKMESSERDYWIAKFKQANINQNTDVMSAFLRISNKFSPKSIVKLTSNSGTDVQLTSRAFDNFMKVGYLEKASTQMKYFQNVSIPGWISTFNEYKMWIEDKNFQSEKITNGINFFSAVMSGDETKLIVSDDLEPYEMAILTPRNSGLADRMDEILTKHGDYPIFFLLGAAHLPGNNGIIKLLRTKGFNIERVCEN